MTDSSPRPVPVTAADVDHDFKAAASAPPGPRVHGFTGRTRVEHADPGHLAADDEWTQIVAHARAAGAEE